MQDRGERVKQTSKDVLRKDLETARAVILENIIRARTEKSVDLSYWVTQLHSNAKLRMELGE